jgi:hypothetical protein
MTIDYLRMKAIKLTSARPEIGKNEISRRQKIIILVATPRGDDHLQASNEHLLIIVVFGRTSPAIEDRIKEKLFFYTACLRASVSKLADTMEAHT